jgi:pimeloyl-ACP methyl ester carboxylesterase
MEHANVERRSGPRKPFRFPLVRQSRTWRACLVLLIALPLSACSQRGAATSPETIPERDDTREEAVRFASGKISLAGTLILPEGTQKDAAVVLFHGSGPQRRDLFTARWFATHGVAALAYDKRGVGESSGDFRAVPFMGLSDDGLAAIEYLKSRKEIDARRIGVWGLSQGGWLGPLAASRSTNVAFVIAVSGPGVSPGEQMIVYYANELRAQGMSEHDVQEASSVRRDIWSYLSSSAGYEKAKTELEQARAKPWYNQAKAQEDDSFGPLQTPAELGKRDHPNNWHQHEMNYDPVPTLRAVRVPALFLFGEKDQLIPVAESVAAIRRVLAEDGHHDFTIREFANGDHGMRLTTGEASGEIDPEYLETMRAWLAAKVRNSP